LKYNPQYKQIKQQILHCFKNEKKEIFLGLLSVLGSIIGFSLNLLGIVLYTLAQILKPVFKVFRKEFGHLRDRLKVLKFSFIFFIHFLPVLLGLGAYDFRKGESWEVALERIAPEFDTVLYYCISGFFFLILFFYILHEGAKNNPIGQSFNLLYGTQKPSKYDHWFLRFCFWIHPETFYIAKKLGWDVFYRLYIYGYYYAFLFLYVFKGILF
jgi:hypothetical protein